MKSLCIKIFSAAVITMFGIAGVQLHAQSNTIREVRLSNSDGFNDLRKIIATNFDFTKSEFKDGVIDSKVAFNISENGEITYLNTVSDCQYVAKELEDIFNNLHLKLKPEDINRKMLAATYIMPVRLDIDNR